MPRFHKQGEHYFVSYVTGPRHVHLGLKLDTNKHSRELKLFAQPALGQCNHDSLDTIKLQNAVFEGIKRANAAHGTKFKAAEILYISDDSPEYVLFSICAKLIIDHFKEELLSQDT